MTLDASIVVALLFIAAMLVFIIVLIGFFQEVFLAIATLRFCKRC